MKLDRRLLSLLQSQRTLLILTILAGFLTGILTVFQARILSSIINSVFLSQSTLAAVRELLLVLLVVIILSGITIWGAEFAARQLAVRIKTSLRDQLYRHITQLGPGYLKQESHNAGVRTGEIIQVVNQGVEALDPYFSQYLPQLALAVLVPLTILILILPVDTLSALILLFTAPLIPLFMVLIGDWANKLTQQQWTTLSRMSAHFLDLLQGLTTLKLFGRSREQVRLIENIGNRYRQTTMGVLRIAFLSALVLEWVAMLSTAVVAVEISLRLLSGRLTFEQAFFVLLLTPQFYLPLRTLGSRFHAGKAGVAAADRIFELLATQPENNLLQNEGTPQLTPSQSQFESVSFELNNIQFGYSDGQNILDHVSIKIPAGKMTALVGPSGAGKSTLINLLLRFVSPQKGEIFINNQSIQAIPITDYLPQISWVPQNPYLFNGSVADNLRLSRSEASLDEIVSAAKHAYAHEFISQLPQGYDTLIGERGAKLSAGQAQRLALARAFLKQAPCLILDEATANLDPDTTNKIQTAMQALIAGRTALLIAHHLTTIQNADQIIFLDHGKVVESGTHSQLIGQRGPYWCMIRGEIPVTTQYVPDLRPPPSIDLFDLQPQPQPVMDAERSGGLSSLVSLLRLLAPYKWLVILSILLGTATVVSGVGLLATSAYLISAAALRPSIAVLQVPIVGVRFFGLARGIFRYLERYVSHNTTFRLLTRLRVWFYQALEPLAPARLMQYQSGDLLARIHQDINSLEEFYVRVIAPPLVWLLVLAVTFSLLSIFSIQLSITLLAFHIFAGLITPFLMRYLSHKDEHQLVTQQSDLSIALVEGIQGMAELRVFDASASHNQEVKELNHSIAKTQSQLGNFASLEAALENTLAQLATWSILLVAIPLVSAGQIEAVYLGTLILAALVSFEAASPLPQAAHSLEKGLAAAGRLDEIVSAQPEVSDSTNPNPAPDFIDLKIKDLTFAYPAANGSHQPIIVINGISLSLEPGQHLAIVGPSGAGKTTLANILLRFWEYHQGQIMLGNHSLNSYQQDDVRALIGVVSQRTHLFNATLRENLQLANPKTNQDQLEQACKLAQIHDFITSLPLGYETWVGEGGMRLSAGEQQRVAIARALLKNAPLLILDEPTANLDPLTESALLSALLSSNRTTLWITHRLVGMESMDQIIVMDEGKIVERGMHCDLLQLGGLYRRMWDLQHQIL